MNRAFVSSLVISSDEVVGGAVVENDLPVGTKLSIVGRIKQAGDDRKWAELHCNIVSRGGSSKRKKSRYIQEKGTSA